MALYITTVKQNSHTDKKNDLYLYEEEDKAENAADRAEERNENEWHEYEERNTWYNPEEGEHFVEPENDEKPDYSKYAVFEYDKVDFNDERVKTLVKANRCFMEPETKKYLTEYFEKYGTKQEQERNGVSLEQKLASYSQSIWNDYVSAVRAFLPKDKLSDRKAVLEASKHALAIQVDVSGAIGIINNEFSKRGVKSSATLVKAIKEAAYPGLSKKQENKKSNDDDFGHGR